MSSALMPWTMFLMRALARRREQHAGDARRAQVLREPLVVAPAAGVVDDDRVVDAVGGVVDRGRVVRVDDLDQRAVREDRVRLLVDLDRSGERAVHRVAAQQARALDEVVVAALAHDDRAQAQAVAATGVRDQDAGEQPPDAAEAVEHDVGSGCLGRDTLAGGVARREDGLEFGAHEVDEVAGVALADGVGVAGDESRDVDRRGAGSDLAQRLEHEHGVAEVELDVAGLTGEAVRLQQLDGRTVDEPAAVDGGHHPVVSVEAADERDHPLGELLSGDPLGTSGVELVGHGHPLGRARGWAASTTSVSWGVTGFYRHALHDSCTRWSDADAPTRHRGAGHPLARRSPARPRSPASAVSGSSSTKRMSCDGDALRHALERRGARGGGHVRRLERAEGLTVARRAARPTRTRSSRGCRRRTRSRTRPLAEPRQFTRATRRRRRRTLRRQGCTGAAGSSSPGHPAVFSAGRGDLTSAAAIHACRQAAQPLDNSLFDLVDLHVDPSGRPDTAHGSQSEGKIHEHPPDHRRHRRHHPAVHRAGSCSR